MNEEPTRSDGASASGEGLEPVDLGDTKTTPLVEVVHPTEPGRAAKVGPRPEVDAALASPNQSSAEPGEGEVPQEATEATEGHSGPLVGGYTPLERSRLPKDHLYYKNEHPQSVRVNEAQRAYATKRYKEGVSLLAISRELGLSKNAIRDVIKKVPGLLPTPAPTPRGEGGTFAKGTSANPGGKPQGALRVQEAFKGCVRQTFDDYKEVERRLMERLRTTGAILKEEEALFKLLHKYQTFGLKMADDREITVKVAEGVSASDAQAAAEILKAELEALGGE